MAGSTFGTIFRITTWGESHGKALGVVIDGCPAGLELSGSDVQAYLDRRKPGTSSLTTQRKEADEVEILSGVFAGHTTGTPISLIVHNTSQHSADYSEIASYYRPGHADYTFDEKYGFRDYRGGGRSSGRETIGRVAAGAIACKVLKSLGVSVNAYTRAIGEIEITPDCVPAGLSPDFSHSVDAPTHPHLPDWVALSLQTPTCMPDLAANDKAIAYLEEAKRNTDSVGGCMECIVTGLPAGIGDPVFEKLDANLAKAIMSIGAVKAVEIGDGTLVSRRKGSENNDAFQVTEDGRVTKKTNHAGGILGGISDGSPLVIRAHVKPTPSIFKTQQTVNQSHEEIEIQIGGRHDPIIVPRAVVVMECMTALTVLDAMMINASAKMDNLCKLYGNGRL